MRRAIGAVVSCAIATAMACDGEIRLGVPTSTLASTDDGGTDGGGASDAPDPSTTGFGTCTTEDDCVLETMHCARGSCVECRDDADCGSGDRSHCDAASGRCVGCRTDADCATERRCDTAIHTCVERCWPSRPCSFGTCEDATGRCIECGPGLACADGDVCSASASCVECTSNADCVESEEDRYCDLVLGRCVRCTANAHCATGLLCDPGAGECHGP
jgi:Cys-rich repeat protein